MVMMDGAYSDSCVQNLKKRAPSSVPVSSQPWDPQGRPPRRRSDGLDNWPESGCTPASLSLCSRVECPSPGLVEPLALEEALGFVRGQLEVGGLLAGETWSPGTGRAGCRGNGYSEEEGSLGLLRYCRAEGMGHPKSRGCLNPKLLIAALSVPGSWLDLVTGELTLKFPSYSSPALSSSLFPAAWSQVQC